MQRTKNICRLGLLMVNLFANFAKLLAEENLQRYLNILRIFSAIWAASKNIGLEQAKRPFVRFDKLVYEPVEGNAWHADHVIPVYKGGGECRLENMRTLCVVCHSEVTRAQQGERKLMRKRAKEQLKLAIMQVKGGSSNEPADAHGDGCASEAGQDAAEDSLFVEVPGSSYSTKSSQA
ncbi:hypothetical protein J5N97_015814 [Dioscorea zingiberensis]|uniref:HNH nuclease domain-containing protein n=1 Tax=Dioscorea zingiberensis TaxID=325984 RepID=A0A9D5HES1_9LILI|nr:hypothetical protein J5N97_015814 [Dioscorea zingiberensis]